MQLYERIFMVLGVVGFVSGVVSTLYAFLKMAYEESFEKPFPRTRAVRWFEVFLNVMLNVPGAINKANQLRGGEPLFRFQPRPSASTPPATE